MRMRIWPAFGEGRGTEVSLRTEGGPGVCIRTARITVGVAIVAVDLVVRG